MLQHYTYTIQVVYLWGQDEAAQICGQDEDEVPNVSFTSPDSGCWNISCLPQGKPFVAIKMWC